MMRALVVSNNYIVVKDGKCYCDANFYYILQRFRKFGGISLCALPRKEAPAYVELDFVAPDEVYFIKKCRVFPSPANSALLGEAVKRADIVIGYNPSVNGEVALYYARKYGKRYMTYLVACVWGSLWYHSLFGKIAAPLRYLSVRMTTKWSDYVLYVTDSFLQRRYPNRRLNTGCSDVQITMPESEVIERRLARIRKRGRNDLIKMATLGSVEVKYKGQQYVIEAMAKLAASGKCNFRYYLIGDGNNSRLASLVKSYGLEESVIFMGLQPFAKVPQILDEMDLYIQPSLTEGLPRSIVEAMSRGLLCLGSDVGGIPELLDEESLFPPKSVGKIAEMVEKITPGRLESQCLRNVNFAKRYEPEHLDHKRREFFDKVIDDINCNRR